MNELCYQLDFLKAMNQKLRSNENMYHIVCNNSCNAFIYYSFEKNEVSVLGKWNSFFDFTISDIKDVMLFYEIIHDDHIEELQEVLFLERTDLKNASAECKLRDKKVWYEFRTSVYYNELGEPVEKIISITDITKFKAQNEELIYMAYFDPLTGLYNRNYFVKLLSEYITRAKEENVIVSALMIDIDDFRKINDGMGMIVGDEIVQEFANALKELCNENMILCRMNSDTYCMAIYNPIGNYSVDSIYKAIQKKTETPFVLVGGQEINLTVCIGVAEYPEASSDALELINCAEIVMYKGKTLGKNNIQFYEQPILNQFLSDLQIENELKDAAINNNFWLNYQPQYSCDGRKLRGVEALIRWKNSENQMISPAIFIPIAEKNGSIIKIGNWVIEQSIRQFSEWREKYNYPMIMSINISSIQYKKKDFVENLIKVIEKYRVDPREIELEITESVLIDDFDTVLEKNRILRSYGIRISLDDFGTGFSSLAYLQKLPIDTLKIDKSFIDSAVVDSTTRIITESIVEMVKQLGCETVAEGVEEDQQFKYLQEIGCNVVQGFFLGKPQSSQDIEAILQSIV